MDRVTTGSTLKKLILPSLYRVIWAAILLWLALAGGMMGYNSAGVILGYMVIGLVILALAVAQPIRAKDLTGPFIGLIMVVAISWAVNGFSGDGAGRLAFWGLAILLYHIALPGREYLSRGAMWAAWIFASLLIYNRFYGGDLDNPNTLAINLWALYWLGRPALWELSEYPGRWEYAWTGGIFIAMMATGSQGGLFALLVSWFWYEWGYQIKPWIFAVGVGAVYFVGMAQFDTAPVRLRMLDQAWQYFLSSPLIGIGPAGYSFIDPSFNPAFETAGAHNFIATTGAELGIWGLLAVAWLGWGIYKHRLSSGFLVAFLVHSLVDIPFMSVLVLLGLMVKLGDVYHDDRIT